MSKYIYGIDFGTTNSAISIIDTTTNEIVKTFNESSLIYFPQPKDRRSELHYFVGKEAIEQYVSNNMHGRFLKSIKRVLPRSGFKETRIFGKKYTAEDLVSLILKYLKKKADNYINFEVKRAVFGRPVVFDENPEKDNLAQQRLLKAAKLAGFEDVAFQMEPIAAAFTYERLIQNPQTVLVADLGGGTSDFTLMKLNPKKLNQVERKSDIIGQGGIYIGGDNFDSAIMWNKGTYHFGRGLTYMDFDTAVELPKSLFLNICSWEKMNFFDTLRLKNALDKFYFLTGNNPRFQNLQTLVKNNLGYSIFQSIEKAKIELSQQESVNLEYSKQGIEINEPISIAEFSNKIVASDVSKIRTYLEDFLQKSNIKSDEIDTVFMTGGTSLAKPIRDFIIDLFGEESLKSGDNFNSVANGLAYSHVLFFKK
ncbi:MAG: putative chaperone protein [Cognaticolwellia sp.]|jgi:hypothetical chaperone protein